MHVVHTHGVWLERLALRGLASYNLFPPIRLASCDSDVQLVPATLLPKMCPHMCIIIPLAVSAVADAPAASFAAGSGAWLAFHNSEPNNGKTVSPYKHGAVESAQYPYQQNHKKVNKGDWHPDESAAHNRDWHPDKPTKHNRD